MSEEPKHTVNAQVDPLSNYVTLSTTLHSTAFTDIYLGRVLDEVAKQVAAKFVELKFNEIILGINPQVVANLASTHAAKQICEAQINLVKKKYD